MQKGLLILFIVICYTSLGQKPDPDFYDKIADEKIIQNLKSANFKEFSSYSNYDLTYQRMEWQIDPSVKFISGSVTSCFKSLVQGMGTIQFDLHSSLTADSIISNGTLLNFSHTNNILSIDLLKQYNSQDKDSLTIYYHGIPTSTGFGSFAKGTHSNTAVIWTLSEPYGAMEWWPCKQSLSDKIDSIDILVTSPEQYRAASNGVLISEKVKNGNRTCHWKHRYPIATYLVAIAVTNYDFYSDYLDLGNGDSIEILNYVYPENLQTAKSQTSATPEIMSLYNNLFGIYPFADEKYGHAQFGWGGGMEHQTMSFMGGFGFELISHELAHQWFGDYITLGSWHDIWLNEGFATYLAGLTYENLLNGEWWIPWKEQVHNSIISQPDGSVYVADTTSVSRVFNGRLSYRKGSYLLHMLRWIVGDELFFQAMKAYATDPDIVNGFANHEQLVKHFEEAADTNLTEFFNDWYYGEGYPIYNILYAQNESNKLIIALSQQTSHTSVDFFEMPVPVRVWNSDSTQYQDYRLINTYNGQAFNLNPGFKISKIEIDPDLWIISKNGEIIYNPDLFLPADVTIFPNPTKDKINFSTSPGKQIKDIRLFSLKGELLKTFSIGSNHTLDLSQFARAPYILQFNIDENLIEKKVIKQ